jgi:hypothetical protein
MGEDITLWSGFPAMSLKWANLKLKGGDLSWVYKPVSIISIKTRDRDTHS